MFSEYTQAGLQAAPEKNMDMTRSTSFSMEFNDSLFNQLVAETLNLPAMEDLSSSCSSPISSITDLGLMTPHSPNDEFKDYSGLTISPQLISNNTLEPGAPFPCFEGSALFECPTTSPPEDSPATTTAPRRTAAVTKPTPKKSSSISSSSSRNNKNIHDKRLENAIAQQRCRQRKKEALDTAVAACEAAERRVRKLETVLLTMVSEERLNKLLENV